MGNSFGQLFCVTTFGESHGGGIGVVVDGCPPRIDLSNNDIQRELDRRRPGQSKITTQRKEPDKCEILSGVFEGKTLGTPITVLVRNEDARPEAYETMRETFRPSHADFTYQAKYGIRNWLGGGRASARETIGRVAAAAIARNVLATFFPKIEIVAFVSQVHRIITKIDRSKVKAAAVEASIVRCPDKAATKMMVDLIEKTRAAGDSLGVFPTNDPATVDAWLAATGMRGEHVITVDGAEQTMREALTSRYDFCRVTPDLLRFIAENSRDAKALRARKDKLDKWLVGRNGLDLVQEFVVHADPDQWLEVLVRLTPRSYSISSSPLVSPHEIQLTVSVVRYRGSDGGHRGGVCSTFLADRAASAPVFLQRSPHFRPPDDRDAPMIMVGPGTGIAPFRGFLQERRALGHEGRNWLFFGDQHYRENF